MASFFRGIDTFQEWNNRIHPEMDYAKSGPGQAMIPTFPADGSVTTPPKIIAARTNLQVRQDVGGYMVEVIHELLVLLKNTEKTLCSDIMHNKFPESYYELVHATADAEAQDLRTPR